MFFSICRRAKEVFRRPPLEDVDGDWLDDDSATEGMSSAGSSSQGSWLDRTCDALRRNDPEMEVLEIDSGHQSLQGEDMLTVSDALTNNQVVTKLILRNVEVGDSLNFEPMIHQNSSISTCRIEDSGGDALIEVAKALTDDSAGTVQELYLRGNEVCPEGAQALGVMLSKNHSLTEFGFCHNGITQEGFSHLAQGLRNNQVLKTLDFLGSRMDDVSIWKLSHALAYNESVEFLCLDFNDFSCCGVKAIASMLRTNNNLKELHLFGNRIDSTGATLLSEALVENSCLKSLILSLNNIGDEGATAIAKALTINTGLRKLWIPANSIGIEGLQAFGRCLPQMKGLEELHVGEFLDNAAPDALLQGLKHNTRLGVLNIESPLCGHRTDTEDTIDYYLRLNRSGRSLLQDSVSPESLWALALEQASKHSSPGGAPDALYHMLRQRPRLLHVCR